MNIVILMGNLTRDPSTRHMQGDSSITEFGIAVSRKYRSGTETKEETTFVDCDCWGKKGEALARYCHKGQRVVLEGRLRLDTWHDKTTGASRSKLKVVVEDFHFADSKPAVAETQPAQPPPDDDEPLPF